MYSKTIIGFLSLTYKFHLKLLLFLNLTVYFFFRDSFDGNMGVAILRSSGFEGLDLSDRLRKFYNISTNEIKPSSKSDRVIIEQIDEISNETFVIIIIIYMKFYFC